MSSEQPWRFLFSFLLIGPDKIGMLQRQPDIVEPVEHTVFPEVIDFESMYRITREHLLRFQIDSQFEAFVRRYPVEQLIDDIGIEHDRQQPILETVIEKYIGKTGRDHGSKAEIRQRPYCVFA